MRISCPWCGPRDLAEFSYQGDATRPRPEPSTQNSAEWNEFVYDRTNPRGQHKEFWQHSGGCRALLTVSRNTQTHEIESVILSRDAGGRP
ncbi:MAG: sarcosine oxidase subunit delta [Rhizobiaceae bacterium]